MGGRQEYFVSYSFPFGVRPLARQHDLEVFGCHTTLTFVPKAASDILLSFAARDS